MHILCTICSDLVNQAENFIVTKCGHIFHYHCLAQWIERSKSCPQCRHKVTERCMFRMYPTVSNENTGDDAATLQSRLDDVQLQLRQQKVTSKEKDDKLSALNIDLKKTEDLLRIYEKKLVSRDSAVSALKEQLDYVKIQNKDINKLKEENESLKKNIQTLNGLQRVLNATCDDVENMLKGYTDVKTIALFATALKRALCESEAKKNESRDRMHAVKQQLAVEKNNVADLQAKIMQLEDNLYNIKRKYEGLKNKRKASEMTDKSIREETAHKQPKISAPFDLNSAVLGDSDTSLSSLANRIEQSDSPYLSLKQSSLALSALFRTAVNCPENIKKSDFAIINAARSHALKQPSEKVPLSIFNKKQPISHDLRDTGHNTTKLDVSYDGLGGHSKLDTFPIPKPKPAIKNNIPKLSSKHKLKRPSVPSGSQDIGKLLEKFNK